MQPPSQGEPKHGAPSPRSFWPAFVAQLLARPRRLLGAFLATPVGVAAALVAPPGASDVALDATPLRAQGPPEPVTSRVTAGAPAPPFADEAAATCPGLPARVLMAISQVESNHGRDPGVSEAGARGPMQFLPGTWRAYAVDGDGDGRADIHNTADAVHTAARHLCANGGADQARLPRAIWNYNHSHRYVDTVMRLAGLPER